MKNPRTTEKWRGTPGGEPKRVSLRSGGNGDPPPHAGGVDPIRALLDLSGDALILVRLPEGGLVDTNESASRLLGYSRAELLSRTLRDFFPSGEEVKSCEMLSLDGAPGRRRSFQTVLRNSRGEETPVEMALDCLVAGGDSYLAVSARDITERLQSEQALKRERDKAQNYLDVAGVILLVIDADGKVSLINQKGCEVLGYGEEEIIGRDWFDTFLPEWSRESVRAAFGLLVEGNVEAAKYFENPVLTRTGEEKMIAWHNTLLRDPSGRVIGSLSSGQDITERRIAEVELWRHREHLEELVQQRTRDFLDSEEKYRTLVENVPLVVYRMKPDGQILFVNRFVEEVFGISPAEIYREPRLWNERVHEEDRAEVDFLRANSLRSGQQMIVEYRARHKKGHLVQVADHAIPFHGADGRVSGVDGIILDITAMKKIQEQLVQAEEIKTLSEVSARLAHEIRNPLASAGGFARRLLSSMNRGDPDRERVEIIVNEVGRLEAILRMILAYLEPLELELTLTDPNRPLENVLRELEPEIREKRIDVAMKLARNVPEIPLDRPKIERVFRILVKKALSQMREGAVLSISTFPDYPLFTFEMSYSVEGMHSDDVEHFFYPFNTSHVLQDPLDLPRAKTLVHKHGGLIGVRMEKSGELIVEMSLPFPPRAKAGKLNENNV